jgi:hypothetical protein
VQAAGQSGSGVHVCAQQKLPVKLAFTESLSSSVWPRKAYGSAAKMFCAVSNPLANAASTVPISEPA